MAISSRSRAGGGYRARGGDVPDRLPVLSGLPRGLGRARCTGCTRRTAGEEATGTARTREAAVAEPALAEPATHAAELEAVVHEGGDAVLEVCFDLCGLVLREVAVLDRVVELALRV